MLTMAGVIKLGAGDPCGGFHVVPGGPLQMCRVILHVNNKAGAGIWE